MRIEVKMDSAYPEPLVLVLTAQLTDEVAALIARLKANGPRTLAGFRNDMVEVLAPDEVLRIYAAAGRVYALTPRGEFTLRQRIYELEAQLDQHSFVRISNSELVNLKNVRSLDLSLAGTICVHLADGSTTYASRRYVARIKRALGL